MMPAYLVLVDGWIAWMDRATAHVYIILFMMLNHLALDQYVYLVDVFTIIMCWLVHLLRLRCRIPKNILIAFDNQGLYGIECDAGGILL